LKIYAHRLAERLSMTVGELGERMSADELFDWWALDNMNKTPQTQQEKFMAEMTRGRT
jgi:hypothetical protein